MTKIPKVLHYVFGMAPDFGGKPWSLVHHVCVSSAIAHIKPDQAFLRYAHEPSGPWWAETRKLLTPVRIEAPREVFGNPLLHVAHQADVVRLQTLAEHGGIYLDADVLVQRPFDDLLDNSTVLVQEGEGAEYGLANAVILAEPQAPFVRRWLEEYRSFRSKGWDEHWNEHSVQLPSRLAREHPDEITVLPHTAFFWPLWTMDHLTWMFGSARPLPPSQAYANHLWEGKAWNWLEDLTPGRVRAVDTNFHRWARPYVRTLPNGYGALPLLQRTQRGGVRALKRMRNRLRGYS